MKVVIIDYGSGNLRSVAKAVEHELPENGRAEVTSDPKALADATHIILPGVGAFGDCAAGLDALPGMHEALDREVLKNKKPFLGICVGMQLLADIGLEHGEHKGFGWIKGVVAPIPNPKETLKIPHMGWNSLVIKKKHPVLDGIETGDHAYFVHSYRFECEEKSCILSEVEYGSSIVAVLCKDNIIATQFHPEKSQKAGLRLLHNFLRLQP